MRYIQKAIINFTPNPQHKPLSQRPNHQRTRLMLAYLVGCQQFQLCIALDLRSPNKFAKKKEGLLHTESHSQDS